MGAVKVKHAGAFQAIGGAAGPWYTNLPGAPTDESGFTTVTADATAHVKGSWTQLIANTSTTASLVVVRARANNSSGVDTSCLVDIAVGASGSETVVIPNIPFGGATDFICTSVPLKVPSGSRISARMQSATGSRTAGIQVAIFNIGDADLLPTSVEAIGANTATSTGVLMSGSANSWVQITSSTANAFKAVVMCIAGAGNNYPTANIRYFTLGKGSAGSEVALGGLITNHSTAEVIWQLTNGTLNVFPADIPAGTRLSVRHNANTVPETFTAVLYGIPAA